jgi:hypothetical protein
MGKPDRSAAIRLPPLRKNYRGQPRHVGVELEMIGLELNDIAELVARYLDLSITTDGRYRRILAGDDAGDWVVELDFDLLMKLGKQDRGEDELLDGAARLGGGPAQAGRGHRGAAGAGQPAAAPAAPRRGRGT